MTARVIGPRLTKNNPQARSGRFGATSSLTGIGVHNNAMTQRWRRTTAATAKVAYPMRYALGCMHKTTRPIEAEEKSQLLQRYRLIKPGCSSRFAYLGMFFILLPAAFAGVVAQLLQRFLDVSMAFVSGITIGVVAGAALYLIKERRERRFARFVAEKRARAEEITSVAVYDLSIARAWRIDDDDLECFLLDATDAYVFLATPVKLHAWFPSRALRLVVAEDVSVVLNVVGSGDRIALMDGVLDSSEVEPWLDELEELRFVPASELPRAWQPEIAAG